MDGGTAREPRATGRRSMGATLAILALALASTAEIPAAAEHRWGFVVHDARDQFVAARWPDTSQVTLGAGDESDLVLRELGTVRATLFWDGRSFGVVPLGPGVTVHGRAVTEATRCELQDRVTVGPYAIQFLSAEDDEVTGDEPAPAEDGEPEDEPDDGAAAAADGASGGAEQGAGGADSEGGAGGTGGTGGAGGAGGPAGAAATSSAAAVARQAGVRGATARSRVFLESEYRLCHDARFGEGPTPGTDFCATFDETSDEACPMPRQRCAAWTPAPPACAFEAEGIFARATPRTGEKADPRDLAQWTCPEGRTLTGKARIPPVETPTPRWFPNLWVPEEVAWAVVAVLIVSALAWFVRTVLGAGWESRDRSHGLADEAPVSEAAIDLLELPAARAGALLRRAEDALARGASGQAAALVHLAVLRYIDDGGLARWHRSKTNGDYVRELTRRQQRDLAALLRDVARQTERIRFGDGAVDELALRAVLDHAGRLLARAPASSPAPPAGSPRGTGATLIALVLIAGTGQACSGAAEPQDLAYHDRSPVGLAALPELLRGAGLPVEVGRPRLPAIPDDVALVVLRESAANPGRWPAALRLAPLLQRGKSVLVLDDRWRTAFFLPPAATATVTEGDRSAGLELSSEGAALTCAARLEPLRALAPQVRLPVGRRLVLEHGLVRGPSRAAGGALRVAPLLADDAAPGLEDGRAAAIAVAAQAWTASATGATAACAATPAGPGCHPAPTSRATRGRLLRGCLYVFADRDLFTNASLTREANARFVTALFARLAGPKGRILFLDRLDSWTVSDLPGDQGDGSSPLRALQASHLLPLILQGLLALVALYLLLGAAFGPLRDPVRREHKGFVEHVEAIGRQYARTGLPGLNHAARSLARLVVLRQRDQAQGVGWNARAEHLARKLNLDENDVRAALRLGIEGVSELGSPSLDDPPPSSERMLRTLSRLVGGRGPQPEGARGARPPAQQRQAGPARDPASREERREWS